MQITQNQIGDGQTIKELRKQIRNTMNEKLQQAWNQYFNDERKSSIIQDIQKAFNIFEKIDAEIKNHYKKTIREVAN